MKYLVVDGMFRGTGVRNAAEGDYVNPADLGLTPALVQKIERWLSRYKKAHYTQFVDGSEVEELDAEGVKICRDIKKEMRDVKVEYYSDAQLKTIWFPDK